MADRRFILEKIIKDNNFKIGAELGVFRGDTTFYLLEKIPDLRLIAVDMWQNYPDYNDPYAKLDLEQIYKDFIIRAEKINDRLIVIKETTFEASRKIEDKSLDFVFIDANHSYEYCRQDILTWRQKIKSGGFIIGHDWDYVSVRQAVNNTLGKVNIQNNTWWIKNE